MKRKLGRTNRRLRARCVFAEALEARRLFTTLYVDAHATSATPNGATWNTAYLDLQQALSVANSGDTIRVADGTYKPGTTTSSTFQLKNGVTIQGGYVGFGAANPNARDIAANKTILTGVVATTGGVSTFALHVVTGSATNSTAVLDGFTITEGFANGTSGTSAGGAGMINSAGSPTVSNCTFYLNYGTNGAGMYNTAAAAPTISNCLFVLNLTQGSGTMGGGMYNSGASPIVSNCQFEGNVATRGGGIYNDNSATPSFTNCLITRNIANNGGGGVYNSSALPTFTGCTISRNDVNLNSNNGGGAYNTASAATYIGCNFLDNFAPNFGGGLYSTQSVSPTVINCIFDGNSATFGGGVFVSFSSSPILVNDTFAANIATSNGMAIYQSSTSANSLTNCVVWGNTGSGFAVGGTITITYSDIQGGAAGTGNVNVDPVFVNAKGADGVAGTEDDDLHLRLDSPLADAGNNSLPALTGITTDFGGSPRFADLPAKVDTGSGTAPIIDMGAYEIVPVSLKADPGGPYLVAAGGSIQLSGFGYSDQPGSLSLAWDLDGDGQYDDATGATPTFSAASLTGPQTIHVGVQVTDGASRITTALTTIKIIPPVLYVDDSAPGANNGGSWTDAYRTLSAAMLDAVPGTEIHVAQGTYTDTASADWFATMTFKTGESLLGGYAGYGAANPDDRNSKTNVTTLSGDIGLAGDNTDNTNRIITVPTTVSSGVLDGFTIRDANGFCPDASGAGIDCQATNFTIRNCTFLRNNSNAGGGALRIDQAGTISNCIFEGNTGGVGGAVYIGQIGNSTDVSFLNCVFTGNTAVQGGAIEHQGNRLKMMDSTIAYNNADTQNPGVDGSAIVSALNCIAYGNKVGTSTAASFASAFPSPSIGNFIDGSDPQFVRAASAGADSVWGTADDDYGDLHLKSTSTLIDVGDNASVPATLLADLDGNNRLVDVPAAHGSGVVVDPGAYESTVAFTATVKTNVPAPTLKVTLSFNANVQVSSIDNGDVTVTNVDTGVPISGLIASTTPSGSFTFAASWQSSTALPDGNYHVSIPAGAISDAVGNPLPALGLDFFSLAGDANQNRVVDTADFTLLATNFNKTSVGFSNGDFNADGVVNALDFNVLAMQFGKTVPAPSAPAVESAPAAPGAQTPMPDLFGSDLIRSTDLVIE